jgi:hypothetical protein
MQTAYGAVKSAIKAELASFFAASVYSPIVVFRQVR